MAFVILSTSFEGLYALFDFSSKDVPIGEVRNLNIDAISRWYFQGIPIDGLQRLLFYQPHHIVGYTIGLIGLLALAIRTRPVDAAAFAIERRVPWAVDRDQLIRGPDGDRGGNALRSSSASSARATIRRGVDPRRRGGDSARRVGRRWSTASATSIAAARSSS